MGHEIINKSTVDPFVEVSLYVPDWTHSPFLSDNTNAGAIYHPSSGPTATDATSARTISYRTGTVKNNGFNPVWHEAFSLPFDCVGGMLDLIFVRFAVRDDKEDDPLAIYCSSLGSLQQGKEDSRRILVDDAEFFILGFRHLPLHDAQLSQYMFSSLFVQIGIHDVV